MNKDQKKNLNILGHSKRDIMTNKFPSANNGYSDWNCGDKDAYPTDADIIIDTHVALCKMLRDLQLYGYVEHKQETWQCFETLMRWHEDPEPPTLRRTLKRDRDLIEEKEMDVYMEAQNAKHPVTFSDPKRQAAFDKAWGEQSKTPKHIKLRKSQ